MENKHQFRVRIRNVNYEYLENYQMNNDYNTIGEAVDAIIAEHRELSKNKGTNHKAKAEKG